MEAPLFISTPFAVDSAHKSLFWRRKTFSNTPLLHYSTAPIFHHSMAPPLHRKKLLLLPTGLVVLPIPMQACSPQMSGSEMLQTACAFDAFFCAHCCRRDI